MTPHDRIRAMRKQLADIKATLAIVDGLIAPGIVALSNSVGDGYWQKGAGSATGHSDPVAGAIARASDAFDLDSQLRLAWTVLVEIPNAVANHLRRAAQLAPRGPSVVASCTSGIHQTGYGVWGRKDGYGAPVRCDEIGEQDRDGLCLGCDKRRARWKAEQRKVAS